MLGKGFPAICLEKNDPGIVFLWFVFWKTIFNIELKPLRDKTYLWIGYYEKKTFKFGAIYSLHMHIHYGCLYTLWQLFSSLQILYCRLKLVQIYAYLFTEFIVFPNTFSMLKGTSIIIYRICTHVQFIFFNKWAILSICMPIITQLGNSLGKYLICSYYKIWSDIRRLYVP